MKDEELILKAVEYCNDIPARVKDFLEQEKPPAKEQPEPEFKVGQWAAFITQILGVKYPFRIDYFKGNDVYGNAFDSYGIRNKCLISDLVSISPQEIESHLRKICNERGYKPGQKLNRLIGCSNFIPIYSCEHYKYTESLDMLELNGTGIYQKGIWAAIVKTRKKLPETKEECKRFVADYQRWCKEGAPTNFWDCYEG